MADRESSIVKRALTGELKTWPSFQRAGARPDTMLRATSHAESPPTLEDDDEVFQNAGATVRL